MTVGDGASCFITGCAQHTARFQDAAITLLRAGMYSGLFSLFPGTQIMPRSGMENHVNADTLTGRLL